MNELWIALSALSQAPFVIFCAVLLVGAIFVANWHAGRR